MSDVVDKFSGLAVIRSNVYGLICHSDISGIQETDTC